MFDALKRYLDVGDDAWVVRRRIAIFTLLFDAALIVWAAEWMRQATALTVLTMAFGMMTFVLTTYVFAALWDDHLKRKSENEFIIATDNKLSPPNMPPVKGN